MDFENINCIAGLKQKNEKAMDIVINKYSKLLYKVIYSILGQYKDEGQIEECLSDVFLSIWNNSHKFLGDESKFKSWICVIAKYKAIDYSRKKLNLGNMHSIDEIDLIIKGSVEEEVLVKEYKEKLFELIDKMKEPDRSIFIKKYFLGDSAEKISKDLGLTKSNVNTHLSRGRKALKEKLNFILGEVI